MGRFAAPGFTAVLATWLGVERSAGLIGLPDGAVGGGLDDFAVALAVVDPGVEIEGPFPTKVDSEGFRPQENMSVPGIFQPLLQPVWLVASIAKTIPVYTQFRVRLRMANNPLIACPKSVQKSVQWSYRLEMIGNIKLIRKSCLDFAIVSSSLLGNL